MSGICEQLSARGVETTLYLDADEEARRLLRRPYTRFLNWLDRAVLDALIEPADNVLVDSYYTDLELLTRLRDRCARLLLIDDNMRLDYRGMTLINPNYFGAYLAYPAGRGNTVYAGRDCTLLRAPFVPDGEHALREEVRRVLVTFGGTDVCGWTDRVVRILHELAPGVALDVAATPAFHNLDLVRRALGENDRLHLNADAEEMSRLMWRADFAVASAGGTSNELIKMQCPAVLTPAADNQLLNIRLLAERGIIRTFTAADTSAVAAMFRLPVRRQLHRRLLSLASERSGIDLVYAQLRERPEKGEERNEGDRE